MGLNGVGAYDGKNEDHWFKTTIGFSVIVHIVIYKMFIETFYWNIISVGICFFAFALYYGVVLIGSAKLVAQIM